MSDLHDPVSSLEDDLLVSGWVVLRDDVGTLILNTVDNCEGRREGGGRRGERGRRRKGRKGGGREREREGRKGEEEWEEGREEGGEGRGGREEGRKGEEEGREDRQLLPAI